MSFSIVGKTAIVTGAAHGIGLAIGRHLLAEGANVMFCDQDEASLERELGTDLTDDGPARIFAGDLRKKLTVTNLLSATVDAFESIDILVNASRQIVRTDPLDADDDSMALMLDQNLLTALRLSQATAKRMIKQSEGQEDSSFGAIINLTSIAARHTHPDLMAFSVANAALEQMTRSLAVALARQRIRVNGVAIGSVMSNSLKDALRDHEDYRQDIVKHTPLRRIAGPAEVCDAVQYLASDASSFVTGQIITIDGGRSLLDPVGASVH